MRRSHRILAAMLTAAAFGLLVPAVFGHEAEEIDDAHDLLTAWGWEPGSWAVLLLSAWLYVAGLRRLWREAGVGRGITRREAWYFAAGWFSLFIALVSPLHPWGEVLFAAHMTQHEILMLVAAPLLVLGRPMIAFLWALPRPWAHRLATWSNRPWWVACWGFITAPVVAWIIHAVVLWTWHIPALFEATTNDWVHALQHASFLGSALLFWWALIHGRRHAVGYGMAVLFLFTTALHSGLLGAMITFASRAWYPEYAHTTQAWGLSPLEDQQLGGLIMWIPACSVYILAGLVLMAGWMRESEARALRREGRLAVTQPGGAL